LTKNNSEMKKRH